MIDVMALRQSYERHEISEMLWINGKDNPADALTNASPNRALNDLMNDNKIEVRLKGWVDRQGTENQRDMIENKSS